MSIEEVLKIVWTVLCAIAISVLLCVLVYNIVLENKRLDGKNKLEIKKLKLDIELNEERLKYLRDIDGVPNTAYDD